MNLVVRNLHTRETDLCASGDLQVDCPQHVIYTSRYGKDIGLAMGPVSPESEKSYRDRFTISGIATDNDLQRWHEQESRAHDAAGVCAERVRDHRLDMRVVSAHYLLDSSKLLFFFVSERRVDFRNLVRDLVNRFHVRVEMRQIGVRDETRIVGGIGICGRRLCCNGISDRLEPVSIRMAKDQNYSLNSMKVSGPCGRLLCCLSYEHRFYKEERKRYPREGALVEVAEDTMRVQEINILSGQVRLHGGGSDGMTVPICALERRGGEKGRSRSRADWVVCQDECPAAAGALSHMDDDDDTATDFRTEDGTE